MGMYYGIFYKDKDGYDLLVQDEDSMLVYPSKAIANVKLSRYVEKVTDTLHPRLEYRKVRDGFFKFRIEPIEPPRLEDWVRRELIQKKNTAFVKPITA